MWAAAAAAAPFDVPPSDGFEEPPRPLPVSEQSAPAAEAGHLYTDEAGLLANPALLERALDSAVAAEQAEGVRVLLPLYARLPQHDTLLRRYAQAMLARADGRYGEAEAVYRGILGERPDLLPVRWQLARTLAENRLNREALAELERLRVAGLPPEAAAQAEAYRSGLLAQEDWAFAGNLRYLHENNVNQAPGRREYGGWTLPEPESARGVGYSLSAGLTRTLAGHWAWRAAAAAEGRFYWDKRRYDDTVLHLGGGAVYRDARQEWAWLPYYERRWFGGQPYSATAGLRVQAAYAFSPHWQVAAEVRHGRRRHDERRFLDGSDSRVSLTAFYRVSPQQFWLLGADWQRVRAADEAEAYRRTAVRAGWEGERAEGWGAAVHLAAAQRHYDAADVFQIRRREREYSVYASLWRPSWQWRGFTPRLSWLSRRTVGNHFAYGYRQNQLFLEIGRRF